PFSYPACAVQQRASECNQSAPPLPMFSVELSRSRRAGVAYWTFAFVFPLRPSRALRFSSWSNQTHSNPPKPHRRFENEDRTMKKRAPSSNKAKRLHPSPIGNASLHRHRRRDRVPFHILGR